MGTVVCALIVLIIGSVLLWRPPESPILWFVFVFQWIELFSPTLLANWEGVTLKSLERYGDPTYATWLAMFGMVLHVIGIRVGAGRADTYQGAIIAQQVHEFSQIRLFKLYLVAVMLVSLVPFVVEIIPGLRHPLGVSVNLKWAAYIILTIVTFSQPTASKGLWVVVFTLEVFQGFFGYFSGFKFVFLFTFLAIMTARYRFKIGQIVGALLLTIIAISLGVTWTAVKPEYRSYLNGGTNQQIITVGAAERIGKLYELTSQLDGEDVRRGGEALSKRLGYISFFGAATEYVPAVVPHAGGSILWDAVSRVFMPRLIFPDKPIIDESALVRKYTGQQVAGIDRGTQISLGFYAESYVDFGVYGMMFCLFGWGFFLGSGYRFLVRGRYSRGVLGYALATVVLLPAYGIGPSSAKLFGGIATSLLVLYFFNRFIVPRYLSWLRLANSSITPVSKHRGV